MLQKLFSDGTPSLSKLAKHEDAVVKAKKLSTRQVNTKRRVDEKIEKKSSKRRKQARKNLSDTDSLGSKAATKNQKKDIEERIKAIAKQTKAPKCSIRVATRGTEAYDYIKKEGVTAYFDPNTIPPEIWYKEGASNYVLNHEYYHYEEYCKIGKEEFIKGANRPTNSFEWHENNILRERYVRDNILKNDTLFSVKELAHAKDYYTKQLIEALKKNIDISKITKN